MSAGLKNSQLDRFRKRFHPNQQIRLYKLADGGQGLNLVAVVSSHFYIGRNTDTSQGAAEWLLTIDSQYALDVNTNLPLDLAQFAKVWGFDLRSNTTGSKQRYKLSTEGNPIVDELRYVFAIHGAFNDQRPQLD